MENVVKLPPGKRAGQLRAESFNEAEYTIDLVWTTGAPVRRYSFVHDEEYDECLSLDPGSVRLDRLNLGAPFCDTHSTACLDDVLGSVVPGSARIEDGVGRCTVKLSRAKGVADSVQKIAEGVIRNISVGYWTHKIIRTEGGENRAARWDVVDWEPLEISAVPVPADSGSQIRSSTPQGAEGENLRSCVLLTRSAAEGIAPEARGQDMADKKFNTEDERLAAFQSAVRGVDAPAETRAADEDDKSDEEREGDEDKDERSPGEETELARAADEDDKSDEERGDDEDDKDERDGDEEEDKDERKRGLTPAEARKIAADAVKADRARAAEVRKIAAKAGFAALGDEHAERGTSVREFKDLVFDKLLARQGKAAPAATGTEGVSVEPAAPGAANARTAFQREMAEGEAHFRRVAGK